MSDTEQILIWLAGIFILGIGGQWLAWRIRLPSILLLLALGILVGPTTGLLHPDALFDDLLLPGVSLSVAVVLFEGSLSLRFRDLRAIGRPLFGLLSVGVLSTWGLCTLAGRFVIDFDWGTALLLGAILVVTGPTVIGPLLQHIRPLGRVGPVSRWEGIVIDPIGALLAVLVFEAQESMLAGGVGEAAAAAAWGLSQTVMIGATIGFVGAWLLKELLGRHWIPDHLQNPVALITVLAAFVCSNLLQHESGLATVTVMGVLLANQRRVSIKHIIEFKENLSVILISALFIVLAARLQWTHIGSLGWRGPGFVAFLILVVRPVSVFLATLGSELSWQERTFLACLAPRGIVAAAVASVFALEVGRAGDQLVAAVFLVISGTVLVYGLTAGAVARGLGLSVRNPQGVLFASAHAGARAIALALQQAEVPVFLVDINRAHIRTAQMEGLPTLYANVLSDSTTEELDLGGIGRLMAMTANDEVNSLASEHFSELFGRSEVYRLAPEVKSSQRKEISAELIGGRILFGEGATYNALDDRFEKGAVVKTTPLTEQFDFDAFRARYGESALVLFVIDDTGQLLIATADRKLTPRPGQRVIALVDEATPAATDQPAETTAS